MKRQTFQRFGRTFIVGFRRREWWIGARDNFQADALEINLLGLTVLVSHEKTASEGTP